MILRDKNLLTQGLADAFFSSGDVVDDPGNGNHAHGAGRHGRRGVQHPGRLHGARHRLQRLHHARRHDRREVHGLHEPGYLDRLAEERLQPGRQDRRRTTRSRIPVAKVVNRIYARIHNAGPATAFDFDVRFRVSEPYHTVGGEADFDTFVGIKHVDSLAAGTKRSSSPSGRRKTTTSRMRA